MLDQEKGTYAAVEFTQDTQKAITKLIADLQLPNFVRGDLLHTTIVYSTADIDYQTENVRNIVLNDGPCWFAIWNTQQDGKCLVLRFNSPFLNKRHQYALDLGAIETYPSYKPHITLAYNMPQKIACPKNLVNIKIVADKEIAISTVFQHLLVKQ